MCDVNHQATSSSSVLSTKFITCTVDIRWRSSGESINDSSRGEETPVERKHECMCSISLGHSVNSTWGYIGTCLISWSVWHFTINTAQTQNRKNMFTLIFLFLLLNIPLLVADFIHPRCFWKMKQNENKDRNQGTGCTFVIHALQQPVEKEYFSHILNIQ